MVQERENVELRALPFINSISIVLWIFSNRAYFCLMIQITTNSSIFCQFLKMIEDWIQRKSIFKNKQIIFLLDNWPCHRSKNNYRNFQGIKYEVFISTKLQFSISPCWALIFFKKRLIWEQKYNVADLKKYWSFW